MAKKQAYEYKLNGWVRYLFDEIVDAVIKVRTAVVEVIIRLCILGPKNAKITK